MLLEHGGIVGGMQLRGCAVGGHFARGASDVLYGMPICEMRGKWSRKKIKTRHCAGSELRAALYMALLRGRLGVAASYPMQMTAMHFCRSALTCAF